MSLQKKLEKLGIEQVEKLDNESIRIVAYNVTEALTKAFPIIYDEYNNILIKLLNCNMYVAKITKPISRVNYIYEDNSIYFDEELNLNRLDEQMIHECIHYLQDNRNTKGKLTKIGLCNFEDFSVNGLGWNEAAVQYISAKAVENIPTTLEKYGVIIKTISPKYYPFLTNLIEQIVFLVGEEALVKGTINGTNEFEEFILDFFEGNTKKIINKFDQMIEINNNISRETEEENKLILKQQIASSYIELQNLIFSTYFNKICPKLSTVEEVDIQKDKALYFRKIMGIEVLKRFETGGFYDTYIEELDKKFNQRLIKIYKERGKNTLSVINKSKIIRLLQRIVSYFTA